MTGSVVVADGMFDDDVVDDDVAELAVALDEVIEELAGDDSPSPSHAVSKRGNAWKREASFFMIGFFLRE